jgi:2',3'-cyclic-nucleotide 2'-phosphodiesterase (5'-nucleotidase family)
MHSRRKFLIQGSLATTAMLALKPFNAIAKAASPFTGISNDSYGRLVFLHTSNLHSGNDNRVIQYINEIKNRNRNAILLKAGQDVQDESGKLIYDVSITGSNESSAITGDYKIITKGKLKTGVISAIPDERGIIQKINTLSAYLKKEKNCAIVICLSQLGYKNKNTPDDITLANQSAHLDIIIGGHSKNFPANPYIALNRNREEVIIHSASGDSYACGLIDIDFDGQGKKKLISFTGRTTKNTSTDRTMPAA